MGHALFILNTGWSHARPNLHLALNLLSVHPTLVITALCHASFTHKLQDELDEHYPADHPNGLYNTKSDGESVRDRIQIVQFGEYKEDLEQSYQMMGDNVIELLTDWSNVLPPIVQEILAGHDTIRGTPNKFRKQVAVVVSDLFIYPVPNIVKALAKTLGRKIPVIAFIPVVAGWIARIYASDAPAPPKAGDNGQITPPPDPQKIPDHVINQAYMARVAGGKEVQMEGETVYDYELVPMIRFCPMQPNIVRCGMYVRQNWASDNTQALILPWTAEVEPIERAKVQKGLKQDFLMMGPQYPESYWRGEVHRKVFQGEDARVMSFLDEMLKSRGGRSVAYFRGRPEIITYVLESLTASNIPWVFSSSSSMWRNIPAEVQAIVERARGSALITSHAPQWDVLKHPATKFFISHCGSNSAIEVCPPSRSQHVGGADEKAILAEIPIVAMPFASDQIDISHLLQREGCGIILNQVKGLHDPETNFELHDGTIIEGTHEAILKESNTVWETLKHEGRYIDMVKNMGRLRETFKDSWESGESRRAMEGFAIYISS